MSSIIPPCASHRCTLPFSFPHAIAFPSGESARAHILSPSTAFKWVLCERGNCQTPLTGWSAALTLGITLAGWAGMGSTRQRQSLH
ncbi:hypothetical protein K503DRAFT_482622 [Rhizopogon vinicolor AM-OR11-026]|uniref:Uncharacterized protein n=1 Tax=Rhizopogon vinicolor AM-OR11-026 TaxID=1314800 RepID=A0A1B7MMV9_9AGAM|nr:hypothetical protein K503DRAFT_482622 [Rhizopogon vinicolor AM-OR11-026]